MITVSVECEDAVLLGGFVSSYPEWLQEMIADGAAKKTKYGLFVESENGYHLAPNGSLLVRMKGVAKGKHSYQVIHNVVEVRR